MTDEQSPKAAGRRDPGPESKEHEMEEYAGGHIEAHHGYIPVWLLVVYFVLFVWGLYYSYSYWGGLGPGRF
ncbi:hypothetical protein HGP14_30045 [Rhizobium sp. P32RR-XVIII]|uniref:hypothetical protein n=1 Tax=Rhizobium sp. P32RR-XVIII TaxID=2726738 RepID=UPI0014575E70|nr:hypothetical protein [Rhizobium sp. P32RR-XVIII]NLS07519.1 hypothetical protein [Rhizobium sp. P32RR-XVIII]